MGTINRTYIHNTITKYSYWSCVHLAVNQGPPHDSCWGVGQRSVAAASESNGSLDVFVGHWHPVHHWAARSLQQAPGLRLEPRKTNMKMRGSCFFHVSVYVHINTHTYYIYSNRTNSDNNTNDDNIYTHVYIYIYTYTHIYIYTYIYIYVYIYILYVCTSIQAHTHRHLNTLRCWTKQDRGFHGIQQIIKFAKMGNFSNQI